MTLPTKISNPMGKIRSITVPAILGITILIAGFFAISPIEQASTVHSASLIESNVSSTGLLIQVVTDNGAGITTGDTVVIDCDQDFVVLDSYWGIDDFDGDEGGEELSVGDGAGNFITVDGTLLIGNSEAGNDQIILLGNSASTAADDVDVQRSWKATIMDDNMSSTGGIHIPVTIFAVGAGNNDIVYTIGATGAFDVGDTLTVTALIQSVSGASCSLTLTT